MLGGLDYRSISVAVQRALSGLLGSSASDGYVIRKSSAVAAGALWLPPAKDQPFHNVEAIPSIASSALTVTLTGWGGADLSPSNPGFLFFPSSTLTNGGFEIVKLTANLTITAPSGASFGHASGRLQHLFLYAQPNGSGGAELVLSNLPPDYPGTFLGQRKITSTTIAAGSTSATGIYASTGRSNVVWIPLAKLQSNQAAAGTWASEITQIDMGPFTVPTCPVRVNRNGADQSINHATQTKVQFNNEVFDLDGVFDSSTNYRFQPNVAGVYAVDFRYAWDINTDQVHIVGYLYKNGTQDTQNAPATSGTKGTQSANTSALILLNGTSDYVEAYVYQDQGGAQNLDGNVTNTYFCAHRIG